MKAPCYNCTDRELHCHSNCGKYKEWIDIRNSSRDMIQKKKNAARIANDRTVDALRKFTGRR